MCDNHARAHGTPQRSALYREINGATRGKKMGRRKRKIGGEEI